ncbi:S8 family peptidase [Cytobacillus sp. Hz8]|uniref:S8 family peptidase n=1 Tax=Cytobacillus sp. Hz8 TaxID=3347168 RepID=UPI0035DEF9C2
MNRSSTLLLVLAVIFSIGAIYFYQNYQSSSISQRKMEKSAKSSVHIQKLRQNHQPHLLHINSIEQGEEIKQNLNTNPEVEIIHHNVQDKSHYMDHEAIVKFHQRQSKQQIQKYIKDINGELLNVLNQTYIFRSRSLSTKEMLHYFQALEGVSFAEPHYLYLQNKLGLPNDLLYQERYQWNLPIIETESGWNVSRGNKSIKIAIVDTGVDLNHPDLKKRLLKGYNVIKKNHNPADDNGHGTHVAGIIASETNNQKGTAGVTWYNKIMPVKVMNKKGYGTSFDIAKGIVWATDHGANVINLSLGNYQPSAVLQEAVQYAYDKNVVLVSAAGNDHTSQPSYPSAFPEVLSVSAVTDDGNLADFSNFGDYIDVTAPGVSIPSTYFKNRYASLSGTSMASPHVAGLAGLILSVNPKLRNQQVMNIIETSAVDIGDKGTDDNFGHGLIDVKNALRKAAGK